jgi:VWFA-related protein
MHVRVATTLVLVAVCAAALPGQAPQTPEPTPVFRAQVDAVELDAFVTDARGNPVTDLTIDDFEVIEDGTRQAITSFALVNIPADRRAEPAARFEPDVQTNDRGEGRVYLFALDEMDHVVALRVRAFMRRFIETHFADNDVGAVVYIGRGDRKHTQDFTNNRRLLLQAVDRFSGFAPDMPLMASGRGGGGAGLSTVDSERLSLLRNRMRALRDLTEFMAGMRGRRKAMLYFTTGLGVDVFDVLDYNGGVRPIAVDDLHHAVTAATRGNVSIYPIDPAGISPGGGSGDAETAPEAGGARELARMQDLRALADATGGFALTNSNSFDGAFTRIVRENSTYYVLGFSSTNERRNGRYRKIEVRVTRPGLQVRSRGGYVAPLGNGRSERPRLTSTELPPGVTDALAAPLASRSVPLRVFAAPFRGPGRNARIVIALEMDAASLGLVPRDGARVGTIAVATAAVAAIGRTHPGMRHEAALALKPDTYERAMLEGVRMLSEMELPPGRYQLRIAGGSTTGRVGSVITDLEVPDFTDDPLMMSGIALTSGSASSAVTVRPVDPLRRELPGPLVATREFAAGDTLVLYAETYSNGDRGAAAVDLDAELRTVLGELVLTVAGETAGDGRDRAGTMSFSAGIPLVDVPPGEYVIRVTARAGTDAERTVTRDIPIRVRAQAR